MLPNGDLSDVGDSTTNRRLKREPASLRLGPEIRVVGTFSNLNNLCTQ